MRIEPYRSAAKEEEFSIDFGQYALRIGWYRGWTFYHLWTDKRTRYARQSKRQSPSGPIDRGCEGLALGSQLVNHTGALRSSGTH